MTRTEYTISTISHLLNSDTNRLHDFLHYNIKNRIKYDHGRNIIHILVFENVENVIPVLNDINIDDEDNIDNFDDVLTILNSKDIYLEEDDYGHIPIFYAAKYKKYKWLKFLREVRPISIENIIFNNDIKAIKNYFSLYPNDINYKSVKTSVYCNNGYHNGITPLMYTMITNKNMDIYNMLMRFNPDMHVKSGHNNDKNILHLAVIFYNYNVVKTLLVYNLSGDVDIFGRLPIYYAVKNQDIDMIRILCPISDINRRDKFGMSLLNLSLSNKNVEITKILLDYGAQ